jgi:hypothetical protein
LQWNFEDEKYLVRGFNRQLDCIQSSVPVEENQVKTAVRRKGLMFRLLRFIGLKGRTPRSLPSQANPSILLGERVDTEDDILHIRNLPDFDGTLGAKDCEYMLQYLTAPYLRIPLLLSFFSNEVRLKALRCRNLQEVLDAALFEPGQWQFFDTKPLITEIPAETRDHLCTPVGLLFNELIMSPDLVLSSIRTMLERVLDMDTGKYSILSEAILYVVRLVVRVEGFILFLGKNRTYKSSTSGFKYYGADSEASIRGLDCGEDAMNAALATQKSLRAVLNEQAFRMIARWIKKAKDEGLMTVACRLHAHLAYLFRNIQVSELTPTSVFAILSCQIFLFNNYKYDLDIDEETLKKNKGRKDVEEYKDDLGIPQVELFDLFQLNRNKIMDWLITNEAERNEVMNSIVEMVEEAEKNVKGIDIEFSPPRKWVSIDQAGLNFRGRFVPLNEYDPECFTTKLSAEARVNFEAWLRETTTLAVNTEINCQLGEFTIKKHVTQPLEQSIQEDQDFATVFKSLTQNDIIQCAEVKHTQHRKWLRLIGMDHDIQVWDPDFRNPVHGFKKLYSVSEPEWLRSLLDPWIARIYPGIELFLGSDSPDFSLLYGYWPRDERDGPQTLKEIVVFRYPRIFQVFNIIEYGRRWYRTMIFSSDPTLCMHSLPFHALSISNELVSCCGDPTITYTPSASVVIIKYVMHDKENHQFFIPSRLLFGTIPDVFLEYYAFWQNKDDSLSGYLVKKDGYFTSTECLSVQLIKSGAEDRAGFGFSNASALISRPIDNDSDGSSWVHLVNTNLVFRMYSNRDSISDIKSVSVKFWGGDDFTLHAVLRSILRLESFSHCLFWSKSVGQDSMNATIDLVELPRLRLTFERRKGEGNEYRYYCLEQTGFYIANCSNLPVIHKIVKDFSTGIILKNDLGEYLLLLSSLSKPTQIRSRKGSNSYKMMFIRTDDEWNTNTGELTYFVFPIHISGTIIQSKSIASTLYLLALYLMTRNYRGAFRLIDNCVCDRPFTQQENQIFRLLGSVKDKMLADGAACRLKLFFVTYGCSDVMENPYNLDEDFFDYITRFDLVSSYCRLSPDQESFILSKMSEDSLNRSPIFVNRERLMKVCFELYFQKSVSKLTVKNFSAQYPVYLQPDPYHAEPFDIDLLDVDKPTYKNMLQKLQYVKYTRPEPCSGPDCISFILKVFEKEKNLGFFFIYELMGNALPMSIIPDSDKPCALGAVFFHILPDSYVFGVQRIILQIMETHKDLAARMPIFEDNRRFKIPTLAGLDIFQTHIKAASTFLKTNKQEIDMTKLRVVTPPIAKPPIIVTASPDILLGEKYGEGRVWLQPRIVDYTSSQRFVSTKLIPDLFQNFHLHYPENEIEILMNAPLSTPKLLVFIAYCAALDTSIEKKGTGITVMNHPSSRSHIARTSVSRLEKDYLDFMLDSKSAQVPYIEFLPLQISSLERLDISSAIKKIQELHDALLTLKNQNLSFGVEGAGNIEDFVNGRNPYFASNLRASGHQLMQVAGQELSLVFLFIFFLNVYLVLLFF